MANYRNSSNFTKSYHDFMEEETDFINNSKENTQQMYENESSSDDSRDYSENLDSKRAFQQNQTFVDMKYISKTLTKYIDVVLIKQPENERELIPNLKVDVVKGKGICLFSLIDVMKSLGFPLAFTMIFYLDISTNSYVYVGNDPIKQDIYIPFPSRKTRKYEVSIKYRKPQNLMVPEMSEEKKICERNFERRNPDMSSNSCFTSTRNKKRIKERYIKDVIEKVNLWRHYHKGYFDPERNNVIQLSLEASAQKVGISKKTLDDYLFQIRAGQKYGFNFEANYDQKIGILRSFVRKKRLEDKEIKLKPHKKIFIPKYEQQNSSQQQFPGSFTQNFNSISQNTTQGTMITHERINSENYDGGMYIDNFEEDLNLDEEQENNDQFIMNEDDFLNNNNDYEYFKMDFEDNNDFNVFRQFERDN